MSRSNTGKILVVTGYLTGVSTISIHSADPGTTGINELSGGSPAYARAARPTFTSNGTGLVSFQLDYNIGAGGQPAYAGFWDVSNNFLEGVLIPGAIPSYGSQGTFHLTVNAQGQ